MQNFILSTSRLPLALGGIISASIALIGAFFASRKRKQTKGITYINTKCSYCKDVLPIGETICNTCGKKQSNLKFGFVTVIITVALFTAAISLYYLLK
jgi:RNA polymerase subunit RPABC4/transcription elongation factor Spt4